MRSQATALLAVLAVGAASAQDNAPAGLLYGDLLSWTGTPRGGQMTFRAGPERVYSCSYDDKTYFERDHRMVTIARTEKGDHLELVTDRNPGSAVCYARTVHILDPPRSVPGVRPQPKNPASPALLFTPRAELSLSGSVMRLAQDSLLLRLRSGERKLIVVRPDTRFLSAGQPANPGSLHANTLVFVRGARDLYNRFEAYQVIWGDIFQPEQ